jgi:hypothetical protein
MINFFRKSRQESLTNSPVGKEGNKYSKYFLYAIGEISLVVIGILIALWVNNWDKETQDQRLGEDLLERIHRDLVQDTINFRSTIISNNNLREEIKGLLVNLYDGVKNIEEVQNMTLIYDKALDQVFSPNDNTYKGMSNSGTLGLIRNVELKEEIVDHYSEYDQKKELLLTINQWMTGVAVTVDTETDFIKFGYDVYDIYTTEEMLNENDFSFLNNKEDRRFKILVRAISATAFNQKARNAYYNELISRCDIVLKSIDLELSIK